MHAGPYVDPRTDAQLQQALELYQRPNVGKDLAAELTAAAWSYLSADLATGGWTRTRLRAAVAFAPNAAAGTTPVVVDVTVAWQGLTPLGEPSDLQRTHVRLGRGSAGQWRVQRLT